MIGLFIVVLLSGITIYLHSHNKSTVAPIMLMVTLSPEIKLGSASFDSLYIYIIVLLGYIYIIQGKLVIGIISRYISLLFFNLLICLISWILFSRNDINTVIVYSLGILKFILLLSECWSLNHSYKKDILTDLFYYISIVVLLNTVFIIFQSLFYEQSLNILKEILSSNEYEYAVAGTYAGKYTRYGGLFKYPMHLGLFNALAFAFMLGTEKGTGKNHILKNVVLFCTFFNGIMSSTKSFFIGAAIVYIVYVIQNFIYTKSRKEIYKSIITFFILLLIYLFRYQLIHIIELIFGVYASYYAYEMLFFFDDFSSVFNSRLGENGAIVPLLQVVKENILFGVGPSSIRGESVMDNAILVILHNGGIIALVSVVIYYFLTLKQLVKNKESILLVVAILACGMGFQIWLSSPLTLWACYYFDIKYNLYKTGVRKNER